jgi:hypothetical protein
MRCFPASDPFANVPLALKDRAANEMNQAGEAFGVRLTGGDSYSVHAELSGTTPARFLSWCEQMNICRVDVDRASDFTTFIGRNPVSLQVVEAYMQKAIPANMIGNLLPDEVFSAMQNVADEVLQASNEKIDSLRAASQAGVYSAQAELEQLERTAVDTLEGFGFKTRRVDDDPLGPPKPHEFTDAERAELLGEFSGVDVADPMADLGGPKDWNGF